VGFSDGAAADDRFSCGGGVGDGSDAFGLRDGVGVADGGGTGVGHDRGIVSGKDGDGEGGDGDGNRTGSLMAVRARSRANDSLRAARDASSAGDAQREGERLDESTIVIDRFEMVNLPIV
jgi:hypothetical protein